LLTFQAPYAGARATAREAVSQYGPFFEVHLSTPIEVCEQRDRKGLYAKARQGLVKGFTGIDDPYEVPEKPELRIDTSACTVAEAVQTIISHIANLGYLPNA
jgi:sulfate adenylyltransferase